MYENNINFIVDREMETLYIIFHANNKIFDNESEITFEHEQVNVYRCLPIIKKKKK